MDQHLLDVLDLIKTGPAQFLVQLGGPISNAQQLQHVLNLDYQPNIRQAQRDTDSDIDDEADISWDAAPNETSGVVFADITGQQKQAIEEWLQANGHGWRPYFVSANKAKGTFLDQSQSKQTSSSTDDFPRTYFFYGSLKMPATLASALDISESEAEARLEAAFIEEYELVRLGKYLALAAPGKIGSAASRTATQGMACKINDWEEEENLAVYESHCYEVANVQLSVHGPGSQVKPVDGFTFVAAGLGE